MARRIQTAKPEPEISTQSDNTQTITGEVRRKIYNALVKDCENEDTATIMSNNDSVCRLWLRLRGTKKLVWDTYDVCPWCKTTIRVDGRCRVCKH